jgi:hypothetical protein
MKIVHPPENPMTCDACKEKRSYIVELDEHGELIWLCAECVEIAWDMIEEHEEMILAKARGTQL